MFVREDKRVGALARLRLVSDPSFNLGLVPV